MEQAQSLDESFVGRGFSRDINGGSKQRLKPLKFLTDQLRRIDEASD